MFHIFKRSLSNLGTNKALTKYGLLSNTVFGLCLRGSGDIIQQTIEKKNNQDKELQLKSYNWSRTCKFRQLFSSLA